MARHMGVRSIRAIPLILAFSMMTAASADAAHGRWRRTTTAPCVTQEAAPAQPKSKEYKSGIEWPEPRLVDPGQPGGAPADAVVLFGGKDLSAWEEGDKWIVRDGIAIANKTNIHTKQSFGDCQLHIEWASPAKVEGNGQGRGNSGVFFMDRYEVQILDSVNNPTYFDGQAASIYKQHPPLVNASRGPGQWQTYDIVFRAPRFDQAGRLVRPAFITVLHNGVLVQDHFALQGETSWDKPPQYNPAPPAAPIRLQFHGNPVQFRNIWLRQLSDQS